MSNLEIPADLSYTTEHEWVSIVDGVATVGITAHAADALGEVVFVALPQVGDDLAEGDVAGEVESHKSVSEVFAPIAGVVTEVNAELAGSPELVGSDPFQGGWLFRLRVTGGTEHLLGADAYAQVAAAAF